MQYGHCVCGSNTQGNELGIFSRNGAVLTANNEKSQIPDIMVVFAHVVILYADNRFLNKLYTMSKRRGQGLETRWQICQMGNSAICGHGRLRSDRIDGSILPAAR